MKLLDLFCGAGGATAGYKRAGFEVTGVDLKPQPHYVGDEFIQADALSILESWLVVKEELARPSMATAVDYQPDLLVDLDDFDAIHASPPCQASSALRTLWPDREHPELIPETRDLLIASGLPYVIENVPGAKLIEPVVLCGSMFGNGANGRQLRRHRLFEASFPIMRPQCQHRGQPVGVYGHGGGGSMTRGYKGTGPEYREAMEMPWASKAEIAQAIPPSFTEHIAYYLSLELAAVAT